MRTSLSTLLLGVALALSAPSSVQAAEHAGRVLIAAGQVTIVRGTERIAAQSGTPVEAGDTVELGPDSNAQLLMTDHSIIALRPQTTFQIKQYQFSGKSAPGEHAFLALLRGGMRTLTGVIGHVRHSEYHVETPTATVGIRGTDYALVYCNNSCRNANGSLAPNGTYGGVIGGRISVTNRSGVHVFGVNQFFRVASESAAPRQLIGPPPFLQDTLQGRGRVGKAVARAESEGAKGEAKESGGAGNSGSESGGAVVAQTGLGGGTGDTSVTSSTTSSAPPVVLLQTVAQATNTPSVNSVLQTLTGTVFYHVSGTQLNIPISCSNPPCDSVVKGSFWLGIDYTSQRATLDSAFVTSSGAVLNIRSPHEGFPVTISNGVVTIDASSSSVGGGARCSDCGPGGTPANLTSMGITGTVSGGTASILLTGTDSSGTHSIPLTLTLATPPTTYAAAIWTPTYNDGGLSIALSRYGLTVDGSGRLTQLGPAYGYLQNTVGTTNTIEGSAPAAGNLVWGAWSGGGAQVTDVNYVSFPTTPTTGFQSFQPWITGTATAALPQASSVTYVPVGSSVNNGSNGTLNYASLTANFVNLVVNVSLNATNLTDGNTLQMDGSAGISPTTARFQNSWNTVTCTGPCVGTGAPSGSFGGFFAGSNAQGAGLVFNAGPSAGTGVYGTVAFAQPGVVSSSLPSSGTVYYQLTGGTVPATACNSAPCGTVYIGAMTLAVNLSTRKAALKAEFVTTSSNTAVYNVGTPFDLGGIPITVSNGTITFNATVDRSSYPNQNGAFRCFNCDSNSTPTAPAPGYLTSMTISGTVTGLQANVTLGGTTDTGSGSFSATLAPATPPNAYGAAAVIPGSGNDSWIAASSAYWGVTQNGSGQLTALRTAVGEPQAAVGAATPVTVGSNSAAGNLVWGQWTGGGASVTDYDYAYYTTPSSGPGSALPWITGDITTSLPTTGSVTYTPIGSIVNGGTGTLNSATFTADFVNRSVSLSLNATNTGSGSTFQMNGSSGISPGSARFGAGFSSVTCTGSCPSGTPGGNFGGFFAGPNADGAGVAFVAGVAGAPGTGVAGVAAFKHP